jgi:hypothetical protein
MSTSNEGIAPVDEREDSHLCFYEILANHFVKVPESGRRILELIVQLWSQSFAANIFALLFHRWVCTETYISIYVRTCSMLFPLYLQQIHSLLMRVILAYRLGFHFSLRGRICFLHLTSCYCKTQITSEHILLL